MITIGFSLTLRALPCVNSVPGTQLTTAAPPSGQEALEFALLNSIEHAERWASFPVQATEWILYTVWRLNRNTIDQINKNIYVVSQNSRNKFC